LNLYNTNKLTNPDQDVANHQIRSLRPLFIRDTVEFERTFFQKKIKSKSGSQKIQTDRLKDWFDGFRKHEFGAHKPSALNYDAWAFFIGFSEMIFPSSLAFSGEVSHHTHGFQDARGRPHTSHLLGTFLASAVMMFKVL